MAIGYALATGSTGVSVRQMGTLSVHRLAEDLPFMWLALVALHLLICSCGSQGAVIGPWRFRLLSVWCVATVGLFRDSLLSRLVLWAMLIGYIIFVLIYGALLVCAEVLRSCRRWSAVMFVVAINILPLSAALVAQRFFARYHA